MILAMSIVDINFEFGFGMPCEQILPSSKAADANSAVYLAPAFWPWISITAAGRHVGMTG